MSKTPEDAVRDLADRLHGHIVHPGNSEYDAARSVWTGSVDRRPALIVRCASAADVRAALTFAREHDLAVAVRSGGHSFAGHGTVDGGMVIDLSHMKGLIIDPTTGIARIEPGLTWGEVAQQANEFGLGITSGDMATVGVGGLTLGGGIGWMARKYGLTIDNLLSVDLVTADGTSLRASADEHPDLFWGLRGGGGNFGIATAFEFHMHRAGIILGGAVFYDVAEAESVMQAYADYAIDARDELTTMALFLQAPPLPFIPAAMHGRTIVAIMACWLGDLEQGERAVAPLRRLGTPVADVLAPMPYPALFKLTEMGTIRGLLHHDRSAFLSGVGDEAIRTIVAHAATIASPGQMAQLRILGGAMSRVAVDASAFSHRDKAALFTVMNTWLHPAESAERFAWTEQFWQAIRPHACGVYVNFLGDEGTGRIREAYRPATYARLAALKGRYDPDNVFRLNQNITPATGTRGEEGREGRVA